MPKMKIDKEHFWQFWKTGKVEGKVYASDKGFIKFYPGGKKATKKYGKELTAKFKEGFRHTYLAEGPAAKESLDNKDLVGCLNKSGAWIGGRLSRNKDTNLIKYVKNDHNGVKIPNSTKYYVQYKWQNSI